MKKLLFILLLSAMGTANAAGVIIGPVSVTTDGTPYRAPIGNIINQSGLSANYISGVTDFDSFVATTTANYSNGVDVDLGDNSAPLDNFYFDLGSVYSIDKIAIWNQQGSATLKAFDLFASADDTFTTNTFLGSYGDILNDGIDDFADVFGFSKISTQFVMIDVTENHGFSNATRLNDVAFRTHSGDVIPAVPVPAAFWLFGTALVGFIGISRRRKVA